MPIQRVTQSDFATRISNIIEARSDLDTAYGPVRDGCIVPQSVVLEEQNDRARQLSLMLSMSDATAFDGYEIDLEGIAYNEGMVRSTGTAAVGEAIFYRTTAFVGSRTVPRGFPLGATDNSTGTRTTYITTESRTTPATWLPTPLNQRYELRVPIMALATGTSSAVGAGRVTTMLRSLDFAGVTNPLATSGARDQETNQQLVDRYMLGVIGRQLGTPAGIDRYVRSLYPASVASGIVYGSDPLLIRADPGAVDVWVKGTAPVQTADNLEYLGIGQLLEILSPPLVSVTSVESGVVVFVEGTDYEVQWDSTGYGYSVRESAGVAFLPGCAAPPAVGDIVTVTYTYDGLIRTIQSGMDDEENLELGRDLLMKRGISVPIAHAAVLKAKKGYNWTTLQTNVTTAVLNYINVTLALDGDVEESDIQQVVRALSGIDNYVTTRLTKTSVVAGVTDIVIARNEYPYLATTDLMIIP